MQPHLLTELHANHLMCDSWMVWSFFMAYFVAGGYYNLVMHLQLYHRWR
jgi:hypothetical protein